MTTFRVTSLRLCAAVGTVIQLSSCSIPQARLHGMSNYSLCASYRGFGGEQAKEELMRRSAFTADEWNLIQSKSIQIGMSEDAFICSWGTPSGWGAINRTTGSWGRSTQYVFRLCRGCSATYVYVRNGKVSSWQN